MSRTPILGLASAAGAGILFGLGLAISQMTDPQKVKNFLDVAAIASGGWDPSLAFVMGGGLLVTMIFYRLARPMREPVIAAEFIIPRQGTVDMPLVAGSALFGVGWGMAGLCPGPAIADLCIAPGEVGLFAAAMLAGSWGMGAVLSARPARRFLAAGDAPAE